MLYVTLMTLVSGIGQLVVYNVLETKARFRHKGVTLLLLLLSLLLDGRQQDPGLTKPLCHLCEAFMQEHLLEVCVLGKETLSDTPIRDLCDAHHPLRVVQVFR